VPPLQEVDELRQFVGLQNIDATVVGDSVPVASGYEVGDIRAARDALIAGGLRILGDGEPKIGAHGKPVLFLYPKDCLGTLTELEEV
jgi:hypothetical protein